MADQEETGLTPGEGAAPPRQTPFKPVAAPAGAAPVTPIVRRPTLRRPGETPVAVPVAQPVIPAPEAVAAPQAGVPITHAEAAKRKTTRVDIPLTANLTGTADETPEFKTVKLRPTPPPQPGSAPLPEGPKPLSPSQVQAAKTKTSRISLDAALGANEPDSGGPKTIRLKRPSELKTGSTGQISIPMVAARKTGLIPPVPVPPAVQQSATARLPTQALPTVAVATSDEEASPTRRKTIKIKRPAAAAGIKINVAQTEGGTEEAPGEEMQALSLPAGMRPIGEAADSTHPAFLVAAVASLLLTLGLIWILAAQTFGPNAALTGYAALQGPDIAPPPGLVSIQ